MKSTNIFIDGVLVDVNVSFWTGSRMLTPADLGLNASEISEAFKLGKKFLVPAKIISRFRTIENRARTLVNKNSFDFPIGNARFVPKSIFPEVLSGLQEYQKEYKSLVQDLILNYSVYRKEMESVYKEAAVTAYINTTPEQHTFGPDYDRDAEKEQFIEGFMKRIATYYPSEESLGGKFALSWAVYEIAAPRLEEGNSDAIAMTAEAQNDYRKQIHTQISSFVSDVVSVLRQDTVKICGRIVSNIKEGKVVRKTTLESLRGFIDRFSNLNFVGDVNIETQLKSLREEFLDKNSNEAFLTDVELQAELGRRLNIIAEAAGEITDISSVTGDYQRRVNWN